MEEKTKRDQQIQILKTKALNFYKNNQAIHIFYLKKGTFKNGIIIESPSSDFFLLSEFIGFDMFPGETVPVFFLEIADITPYKKKEFK